MASRVGSRSNKDQVHLDTRLKEHTSMARLLLCVSGVLVLIEAAHTQRLQDRRGVNRPYEYSRESQNRELPTTRNSFYPSWNNQPYRRVSNYQRRQGDLDARSNQFVSNIQRSQGDLDAIPNQRVSDFQRRNEDQGARRTFGQRDSSPRIYGRRKGFNSNSFSFRPESAGYRKSTDGAINPGFRSAFESPQGRAPATNGNRLRNTQTPYSPTTFSRRRTQRPKASVRKRLPRKMNKSWRSSSFQKQNRDDRKKWISESMKLIRDNIILKIAPATNDRVNDASLPSWKPGPTIAAQDPQKEQFPQPEKSIAVEQVKNVRTIVESTKSLPALDIYKTNTTPHHPYLLQDFDPEFLPNTLALGATFHSPGTFDGPVKIRMELIFRNLCLS